MKILFFSPLCGRTGSEMVLYNFIRHADRRRMAMTVACGTSGALLTAFPEDVHTFNYTDAPAPPGRLSVIARLLTSVYHRAYRYVHKEMPAAPRRTDEEAVERIHRLVGADVWYLNTIGQPKILRLARKLGVPVALHSHELEQILVHLTAQDVRDIINYPALVIASSEAAADVLRVLGRDRGVEICYEAVDVGRIKSDPLKVRAVRDRVGAREGEFVWAMSGTLDPNKNPALFAEVAREVSEKAGGGARFMWIGGAESGYSIFAAEKARRLGLGPVLTWVPARTDDYYDHLDAADGFVLTSTRDCFPLTMIEAAALGKPIVSFDSGGVREFVRPGMGQVLSGTWNVSDLARAMLGVMDGGVAFDPRVAAARAAEFDVAKQVVRWQDILEEYFGAGRSITREGGGETGKHASE